MEDESAQHPSLPNASTPLASLSRPVIIENCRTVRINRNLVTGPQAPQNHHRLSVLV